MMVSEREVLLGVDVHCNLRDKSHNLFQAINHLIDKLIDYKVPFNLNPNFAIENSIFLSI